MQLRLSSNIQDGHSGELLLSLTYWPDLGILGGVIMEAVNLRKSDVFGLSGLQFHNSNQHTKYSYRYD